MTDTAALEQAIGTAPGNAAFVLNTANKELVRQWIVAKGFDEGRASSARENTLFKAYTIPSYLRAMLTRGDYNSGAARPPKGTQRPEAQYKPDPAPKPAIPYGWSECPKCDSLYNVPGDVCPKCAEPLPLTPDMQEPKPMQNGHDTAPDTFDAMRMISAGIQAIAGQTINEDRVIELVKQHAPVHEITREKLVIQAHDGERRELPDEARHERFPDILAATLANIPVMLVGPAGTGKTTVCKQIAEAVGIPFSHIGAVTSRFELSGFVDAHGNYQSTPFFHAYTEGRVFLFDEVDGSDPSALLWCNTAIANGFCAFPHGEFERHPDFRLIAAANTYGHGQDRVYAGRNQLDGASLDRFITIDYDYDQKLERLVFGDTAWTDRVQKVRKAVDVLKLRHVVSSRAIDYGAKLLAAGINQEQVEKMTLWKGLDSAAVAKICNNVEF